MTEYLTDGVTNGAIIRKIIKNLLAQNIGMFNPSTLEEARIVLKDNDIIEIIEYGFSWRDSSEGSKFWIDVKNRIMKDRREA